MYICRSMHYESSIDLNGQIILNLGCIYIYIHIMSWELAEGVKHKE